MRFPFKKPFNFSTCTLEQKARFIKLCCQTRVDLYQKNRIQLFGRTHSIYLETVKALGNYMDGYLKQDLDKLLTTAEQQYAKYCGKQIGWSRLYEYKEKPLNDRDIDWALQLINQLFLGNYEYYRFATSPPLGLSSGFDIYLNGTLVTERRKWEAFFPEAERSDQMLCEVMRPAMKSILIAGCILALAMEGVGLTFLTTLFLATLLYACSGEISDDVAYCFNTQIKPTLLGGVNPGF